MRATAYVIEDARTGEVLASSHPHAHLAIASLTKLMTVLLTLQHHKLTDVVTVDPRAAAVGESSIDLRSGEQMTVRDLLKGALIQSANDAADALALSMAPDYPSFALLMNAEAAKLGLRDTHFVRPDGLAAPDEYSSADDITELARLVMRTRFVRETVREETDTISGGRTLHTWDDLLSEFPQTIGVKTGHTDQAGWCQVAAARGPGVTIYATLLGSPFNYQITATGTPTSYAATGLPAGLTLSACARGAQRRPAVAPDLGTRAVPRRSRSAVGAHLRRREPALRSRPAGARRGEAAAHGRPARTAAHRDRRGARGGLPAGFPGGRDRAGRDPPGRPPRRETRPGGFPQH